MDSKIFAASIIALVLIFYAVLAWRRKARFRALALELGGTYTDTGKFAPGKVTGRDFSIQARTVGFGRHSAYYTMLEVFGGDMPDKYLLKTPFFENYPNWKFAKTLGTSNERVFVTTISVPRYLELSQEQQATLLSWLDRSSLNIKEFHTCLKRSRIKELVVSETSISTQFKGIVSDPGRLRDTLNVLRRFPH